MQESLRFGPLGHGTVHLCIDMQCLFAPGGPWETPWMTRVLPVVAALAAFRPERTIFTRFIPPRRPEEMPGTWRRYYGVWREVTRERVDPALLGLVPPLARLVPPAMVFDKPVYSAFAGVRLHRLLRARGVDTLILSGAETDVCVLSTLLGAVDLGYRVVVVGDAVCSSSDTGHDALMTIYRERLSQQVETATAETVMAAWHA